jgi:cytochrome P450
LKENKEHWAKLQDLAAANNPESDKTIRDYVLEAQRLTTSQTVWRVCLADTVIEGQSFKKGDTALLPLVSHLRDIRRSQLTFEKGVGSRDATVVPNPSAFKPGRPKEAYLAFGEGAHECLGREIVIVFGVEMLKLAAGLKNLRPAPGEMGELKTVMIGQQRMYLNEDWSQLTSDATSKFSVFIL